MSKRITLDLYEVVEASGAETTYYGGWMMVNDKQIGCDGATDRGDSPLSLAFDTVVEEIEKVLGGALADEEHDQLNELLCSGAVNYGIKYFINISDGGESSLKFEIVEDKEHRKRILEQRIVEAYKGLKDLGMQPKEIERHLYIECEYKQ